MPRDPATHVGAVVKVDGVELACDPSAGPVPLSGLKVTWGRSSLVEKPAAATCDFELADAGSTYATLVKYGSVVEVLGVPPEGQGNPYRVFYGHVSDLTASHDDVDVNIKVTAIDPTARFSSVTIGDEPWPQETVAARRTRIRNLLGGDMAFLWPAIPTGTNAVTAFPVIAKDVDSQPAWGLITDFLWGLGVVAWPLPGSAGQPAIQQTPTGVWPVGTTDTRSSRGVPVANFTGTAGSVPTVCLDACDLDLEGVEFAARPEDIAQDVRVIWGRDDDEEDGKTTAGVYVLKAAPRRPSWNAGRILEITSDVAGSDNVSGSTRAGKVAGNWASQLGRGDLQIQDPWRVGAVRLDPDTVTAMLSFHEAMARLLRVDTRNSHAVLLQQLPSWVPWRSTGSNPNWAKGDAVTEILATLQGGAYEFTDGRWLLELNLSVQDALVSALAPPTSRVVRPNDIVGLPHDAEGIVAEPQTHWDLNQYAVFTDGRWGWDGTKWVRNGPQPVPVAPGDAATLPHNDYRVQPNPSTAWAFGQYATFPEGTYTWDGDAWAAVTVVSPGDVVLKPHTASNVVPDPTAAWEPDDYATFTDGQWRWDGSAWAVPVRVVVRPGSTVNVPHDDPTVVAEPTTAWATGQYATFSDGTYTWDGSAWVEYAPLQVAPGDVVDVPHDDPTVAANPATAWDGEDYATFSDGMYTWNGSAWVTAVATVYVNLNPNPSVEVDGTGYAAPSATGSVASVASTRAVEGARMLKVKWAGGGGTGLVEDIRADFTVPTEVGKTYTATASVNLTGPLKGTVDEGTLDPRSRCIVANGVVSNQPPNAEGTYVVSVTFTATAASTVVSLYNGAKGDRYSETYWDLITVVEGSTPVQFSGDTPADPDGSPAYAWTGTPHASTSVMRVTRQVQWINAPEGIAWEDVPAGTSWTEWTGEV